MAGILGPSKAPADRTSACITFIRSPHATLELHPSRLIRPPCRSRRMGALSLAHLIHELIKWMRRRWLVCVPPIRIRLEMSRWLWCGLACLKKPQPHTRFPHIRRFPFAGAASNNSAWAFYPQRSFGVARTARPHAGFMACLLRLAFIIAFVERLCDKIIWLARAHGI